MFCLNLRIRRFSSVYHILQNVYNTQKLLFNSLETKQFVNSRKQSKCWTRTFSSDTSQRLHQVDPYGLVEDDLRLIHADIKEKLMQETRIEELKQISTYYFDGQGKGFRPMLITLMARAVNYHLGKDEISKSQRQVAMLAEIVHTLFLIHDDIIDDADIRRGKPSINVMWNTRKVAMVGTHIIGTASMMMAQLRNDDASIVFSQILDDIIRGEILQHDVHSAEAGNERFERYLLKTYKKTASPLANFLKIVTMFSDASPEIREMAYQYGRNVGLAFQLVDDLLDFISSTDTMGKPATADLKQGLATAPVLFASEEFPEINTMIARQFNEPGDVERTLELIKKSSGLQQTKFLAEKHCKAAIRLLDQLSDSPYKNGLCVACNLVLNRMK